MQAKKYQSLIIFFILLNYFLVFIKTCQAEEIKLISDTETETFLQELVAPFLKLAELKESKIFLVQDDSVNAFVDENYHIFIHTGLLTKFNKVEVLLGVLAHEIGHIAGKHMVKSSVYQQNSQSKVLFGYAMAISALLAKSPDTATALALATNDGIYKMQLKYSRQQEDSADLMAIEFLEALNYPVVGLQEIFRFFLQQSSAENTFDKYSRDQQEYLQTHPLSEKRLARILQYQQKNHINWQKIKQLNDKLWLIQAKLDGFLLPTEVVLKKYSDDQQTTHQIAQAIAYFRLNQYQKSLKTLDKAIKNNTKNGFLYELKAELLQKSNQTELAIVNYQKAIAMLNLQQSGLARLILAEMILNNLNNYANLIDFIEQKLLEAKIYLEDKPLFFKQMANIYHFKKQNSYANFYLGKYYFLLKNPQKAKELWQEALKTQPKLNEALKLEVLELVD